MKTNQILTALNLSNLKNFKDHASKLSLIYDHIKSISHEIVNVETSEIDLFFGKETYKELRYNELETYTNYEGEKMKAKLFKISTKTGMYNVSIPINNSFFYAFCDLIPSFIDPMQKDSMQIDTMQIDSICDILIDMPVEIINDCKIAAKFINKKGYNPRLNGVCIDIQNNQCNIVATDGHKLFKSETYVVNNIESMQILISLQDINAICAKKANSLQIEVYFKPDSMQIDYCIANDYKFIPIDEKYVDYNCVMPKYDTFMEFDKNHFIKLLKIVKKSANKVTKQVNFHLNGSIEMTANDHEFGSNANVNMNYLSKNFKDSDIGFNSDLLLDCLNSFSESNTLQMFTEGFYNKAIILKAKESKKEVLLMPVIISQ